ncbi:molecular chaperone [Utexia brackfieldae]|uniref:fimbrial biogenesis chaperone n=1 Tax=Utexia brackfieldae TaxID=3074108 RepID=UPI00370D59B2
MKEIHKQLLKHYQQMICFILFNIMLLGNASAAIVISPTNVFIENSQKSSALWLENRGDKPQVMQVRVFKWTQNQGENKLEEQKQVIASPPMINIAPGKMQLVRVINTAPVAPDQSLFYRIVIDEIPSPQATKAIDLGVNFRFRYSVPLFVYGQNIDFKKQSGEKLMPNLSWQTVVEKNKYYLEIYNNNNVHVHLEQININDQKASLATPYILPNNHVRLPLPNNLKSVAKVNVTLDSKDYLVRKH